MYGKNNSVNDGRSYLLTLNLHEMSFKMADVQLGN